MASIFDDLSPDSREIGNSGLYMYDADTSYDEKGQGYRTQGIQAFEVDKLTPEGLVEGQLGGQIATDETVRAINAMGYTNPVFSDEMDVTGKRIITDYTDDAGRSWRREQAASSMAPVGAGYDPFSSLSFSTKFRDLLKTADDYSDKESDIAAKNIAKLIQEESQHQQLFKRAQDVSGEAYSRRMSAYAWAKQNGYDDFQAEQLAKKSVEGLHEDLADIERVGMDTTGESTQTWTDSFGTGLSGIYEGARGIQSLVGEKLGIESWEAAGEGGVLRNRAEIADRGRILLDYKDVDSFGDAMEFLGNNLFMSLPYLGLTAASALASPLVLPGAMATAAGAVGTITGTVGTATAAGLAMAPAAVYTGQAWNEMGDQIKDKEGATRSATVAIMTGVTQAVLDRLGYQGIFSKSKASKSLLKEAAEKLAVDRGINAKEAMNVVLDMTRREIAGLAGNAADVAKNQLSARNMFIKFASKAGVGGLSEGSTEALQEAVAAIGADIGSGQPIDWNDVLDRSIAGAIAGGTLGAALTVPGSTTDAVGWANVAWGASPMDVNKQSISAKFAEEEFNSEFEKNKEAALNSGMEPEEAEAWAERNTTVPRVDQARDAIVNASQDALETLDDQANRHETRLKNRSTTEIITDALSSAPALWRGATRWIFNTDLQSKYRSARVLADMFGGNLQKVFSGASYENFKHHLVTKYKNMVAIPDNYYLALNDGKNPSYSQKRVISDNFYNLMRTLTKDKNNLDENGNLKLDAIPDGPYKSTYQSMVKELQALADRMYDDQVDAGGEINKLTNYLLRYKALDKGAVNKNKEKFISLLVSEGGMTEANARATTDQILSNDQLHDIDEAFSVVRGGPIPGSHHERTINMAENEKFDMFMERDVFANASQAAKSAARFVANRQYVGKNGSVISALLEEMQREGATQEEVDKIAYQMRNYLDAESGNYKRPTSAFGKGLEKVQKNFMFFVTLAGLPLATISSFVEAALTMRGLTSEQIFGKSGGLSMMAKEFAEMMNTGMDEIGKVGRTAARLKGKETQYNTKGRQILYETGFYDWDVGAATTTGVSEVNAWQNRWLDVFFKATGLQGWTNFTRAVRASIIGDYISDNMDIINQHPKGERDTNEVMEAKEKLRNIGIDYTLVNRFMNGDLDKDIASGKVSKDILNDMIKEAQFNFINEAVALPQSANRPLIYQDPRFALFNQFQGFVSTFTANHIPRLWGEYIKRGSPAMKYNTFAMMATMIMLGFASQYLKDLIKHGKIIHIFTEDDLPGLLSSNEYLDTAEMLQRGVRSSGLLGTSERILDQFFPLYEQRSDGMLEWAFNAGTGESAAISTLEGLGRAGGKFLEGDVEGGIYQTLKRTPVTGPFTALNKQIARDTWDFLGGNE
jgi:hypothetical protein